jgi:mannonate dehydratase
MPAVVHSESSSMRPTWRWFGPGDPVAVADAVQAGATGIVSSLHHLPDGVAWPVDEVLRHQHRIAAAGSEWAVVESIPVCNEIRTGAPDRAQYVANYKDSLRAVATAGICTVCYNFIPLVDWMRTDFRYPVPSGLALRFDMIDFAACDIFILRRPGASGCYTDAVIAAAELRFAEMDPDRCQELERIVLAPLPGGTVAYDRGNFFRALEPYKDISAVDYFNNFVEFLSQVIPVAEDLGIRLALHPDDPPFPLFGLPRIAGTAAQLRAVLAASDSPAHGLTFCTGSLGAGEDNDVAAMAAEFAPRISFAHLRNVRREGGNSFHESEHLVGSVDMMAVIRALIKEETRRREAGSADAEIPMRPDHGHLMLDDIAKTGTKPGYSAIGRMKGLAELRAVEMALRWSDATAAPAPRSA